VPSFGPNQQATPTAPRVQVSSANLYDHKIIRQTHTPRQVFESDTETPFRNSASACRRPVRQVQSRARGTRPQITQPGSPLLRVLSQAADIRTEGSENAATGASTPI
jgi:hypothetical protein